MTSILPPPADAFTFAERLRRHEPLLGAFITPDQVSSDHLPGLDFVVLSAAAPLGLVKDLQLPVLILVGTAEQVAAARAAGADGAIAGEESELSCRNGVDAVLSDSGRARWVGSPDAARTAFTSGADLVVYDLPAMMGSLVATLASGRPASPTLIDREPFVLLSGMLGDASLWDGVAQRLGDVLLPWPARIDLDDSIPEMAASVLAEAPPRFMLGGHSLGAIVALEIMRQAPERVSRLVLLNASARGPAQAQLDMWAAWRQRTIGGEFDQIAAQLAQATLASSRRDDAGLVEANARMSRAVGANGFLRQLSAQTTRPDNLGSLAAIDVPVLVISGELDEICPPELQRELVDHCPPAELVFIKGAGHMLPLEAPDAVVEHLRNWLARR